MALGCCATCDVITHYLQHDWVEDYLDTQGIRERMANFMTLFRALMPDLYPLLHFVLVPYDNHVTILISSAMPLYRHNYFVEEEVDVNEWATSWLQHLLSRELPLPCLLRLWDVYFSQGGKLENHVFVCLGR